MDDRLRRLVEELAPQVPARATNAPGCEKGELVVAASTAGDLRRTFLITDVDDGTKTINVLLVSNEVEMATDFDLVVRSADSGAGYDLLAQGELYGVMFPEQLRALVGQVPNEATKAVASALSTDGESLVGYTVGPPLAHAQDPRRSFKEAELAELHAFTADCRRFLVDGVPQLVSIDPLLLLPPEPGTDPFEVQERIVDVIDLLDSLQGVGHAVLTNLFDHLTPRELRDLDRWRTEFNFNMVQRVQQEIGAVLLPVEEPVDGRSARQNMLRSLASADVSTVELWTIESEHWLGLEIEETTMGICRGKARLAGASQ